MQLSALPVVVIGAGPVGLAAAAHLLSKNETPLVFEAGASAGASVRAWGHVQMFSPWRYNVDAVAAGMLEAAGWNMPPADDYLTGRELAERYLAPLAALPQVRPHLRFGTRVVRVTRQGFDKMKTVGRDQAAFLLQVETTDGRSEVVLAKALIDASGTYSSPNPLGASSIPAVGETALAARTFYGIPDVLGAQRARYVGRRVLVVGSGHSAFNALLDLAALAEHEPDTTVTWVVRRTQIGQLYGGGANDLLPERGRLGQRLRRLVADGVVRVVMGFKIAALRRTDQGVAVVGEHETLLADEIIATTGFRPDLAMLSELQLGLDPAVESPVALAPLIDPNVHSCGTVRPHGALELAHPEPGFYIVGMKSYGRAPTFLLLTGYEQVRSVVCALTGDEAGARAVELELPETGVCSSDRGESACCAPAVAIGTTIALVEADPRSANGRSSCCG